MKVSNKLENEIVEKKGLSKTIKKRLRIHFLNFFAALASSLVFSSLKVRISDSILSNSLGQQLSMLRSRSANWKLKFKLKVFGRFYPQQSFVKIAFFENVTIVCRCELFKSAIQRRNLKILRSGSEIFRCQFYKKKKKNQTCSSLFLSSCSFFSSSLWKCSLNSISLCAQSSLNSFCNKSNMSTIAHIIAPQIFPILEICSPSLNASRSSPCVSFIFL